MKKSIHRRKSNRTELFFTELVLVCSHWQHFGLYRLVQLGCQWLLTIVLI